ncbi:unnamed protein product [Dovyalis caffra]|uniref:Uncharacterized protein n=1 Tax=Dovyalis caffra TaxID=77055 RepID=A0AAV1RIV7_9ROSI|nr:unnamed protein product [Dovyalis caffra]
MERDFGVARWEVETPSLVMDRHSYHLAETGESIDDVINEKPTRKVMEYGVKMEYCANGLTKDYSNETWSQCWAFYEDFLSSSDHLILKISPRRRRHLDVYLGDSCFLCDLFFDDATIYMTDAHPE